MKSFVFAALFLAGAAVSVPALAQFQKPEDAVKYRQSAMALIGNHFGRIFGQLKADKPNVQTIQSSAALVETLGALPFEAFVPDSTLPNSKAKPEIWTEQEKFKAAAQKMQAAVAKLNTAAKGGDVAAIKAAFSDAGGTCKGCHDDFRAKQ
jgi:cytochrome c556